MDPFVRSSLRTSWIQLFIGCYKANWCVYSFKYLYTWCMFRQPNLTTNTFLILCPLQMLTTYHALLTLHLYHPVAYNHLGLLTQNEFSSLTKTAREHANPVYCLYATSMGVTTIVKENTQTEKHNTMCNLILY